MKDDTNELLKTLPRIKRLTIIPLLIKKICHKFFLI